MDAFLNFLIKNNVLIIEVLFGLILLVALLLLFRAFLRSEASGGAGVGAQTSTGDLSQLEANLKKLLEQNLAPNTASSIIVSGEGGEALAQLRDELETKSREVQSLKSSLQELKSSKAAGQGDGGISPEEKKQLESKLSELQAKLTEYEIISEDIADLSRFRDENSKLKERIKDLEKGGQSAPTTPATAATSASQPSSASVASPPEASTMVTPEPLAAPEVAKSEASVVDDDLLAEFAKAVAEQKGNSPSGPVAGTATASLESPFEGQINVDKVGQEAAGMPSGDGKPPVNSLAQGLDADKLLVEAGSMDEEKNLMGQFEQFAGKDQGS